MPISGRTFFIWNETKGDAGDFLESGRKFCSGNYSDNNYINLSSYCMQIFEKVCCSKGPNSNSLTQNIKFIYLPGSYTIRIYAEGWGSGFLVLWEGEENELLDYLREYQDDDDDDDVVIDDDDEEWEVRGFMTQVMIINHLSSVQNEGRPCLHAQRERRALSLLRP
jgi:hypothetical protein